MTSLQRGTPQRHPTLLLPRQPRCLCVQRAGRRHWPALHRGSKCGAACRARLAAAFRRASQTSLSTSLFKLADPEPHTPSLPSLSGGEVQDPAAPLLSIVGCGSLLGGQVVSIVLLRLRTLPLLWCASASPSVTRRHDEHSPVLCGATSTHPVVRLPPTFGRLPALCAWPPPWSPRLRAETQILCPFPECPHPLLCPGRR